MLSVTKSQKEKVRVLLRKLLYMLVYYSVAKGRDTNKGIGLDHEGDVARHEVRQWIKLPLMQLASSTTISLSSFAAGTSKAGQPHIAIWTRRSGSWPVGLIWPVAWLDGELSSLHHFVKETKISTPDERLRKPLSCKIWRKRAMDKNMPSEAIWVDVRAEFSPRKKFWKWSAVVTGFGVDLKFPVWKGY